MNLEDFVIAEYMLDLPSKHIGKGDPMSDDRGTLAPTEHHPAADSAKEFIVAIPAAELSLILEAFASTAIEGNRLAEICCATLDRMMKGQPVSDRYLLGLAWTIRNTKETP